MAEVKTYYVPNGPANLAALFPSIDFENVAEYYIEVLSGGTVVATTPMNYMYGCEADEDYFRIHFLNSLGGVDAVSFKMINNTHESKSDSYQKPTSYPLLKTDHSIGRFNVKSNDIIKGRTVKYYEQHMEWLDELFDSPVAWIEQPDIQGQGVTYVPIIILDQKHIKMKEEDRFIYEVEIEFTFSHDKFIIRN